MKQQRKNFYMAVNNKKLKPFLHQKIFEISKNIDVTQKQIDNMKITIAENLFKNFEDLRELVLNSRPGNWKLSINNSRNYKDYYDCRLSFPSLQHQLYDTTKKIINHVYQKNTKHMDKTIEVNWFKQIKNKKANFATPHSDQVFNSQMYTCLIYLNSKKESSGGTAFFKHKELNIHNDFFDENFKNFNLQHQDAIENGQNYWPNEKYWELTSYIEMNPNRLIIFPSDYFHAAYHPINSFFKFPRLTLVYWMTETNEV